jgi:polyhydroxyalkanoate synthesis regulator phasin
MSVETFQGHLGQAFTSPDPAVQEAAQTANQYTEMFKQGQLSKDEYQQLMADLATSARINQSINDMANLELLNTAINGLINLASLAE